MAKCHFCERWFRNRQSVRAHLARCREYQRHLDGEGEDEIYTPIPAAAAVEPEPHHVYECTAIRCGALAVANILQASCSLCGGRVKCIGETRDELGVYAYDVMRGTYDPHKPSLL